METKIRGVETEYWRPWEVARGAETILRGLEVIRVSGDPGGHSRGSGSPAPPTFYNICSFLQKNIQLKRPIELIEQQGIPLFLFTK